MHDLMLTEIVKACRKRISEGDCPTTTAFATEPLEDSVVALADRLAREQSKLDAIRAEVGGDWGINPTSAIKRIQKLLGMGPPPCTHQLGFASTVPTCIHCGEQMP